MEVPVCDVASRVCNDHNAFEQANNEIQILLIDEITVEMVFDATVVELAFPPGQELQSPR